MAYIPPTIDNTKISKVSPAVSGNVPVLTSTGELEDSGVAPAGFVPEEQYQELLEAFNALKARVDAFGWI